MGGVLLRLIDTAGIRESTDQVERLGVDRSRQAMAQAQLPKLRGCDAHSSVILSPADSVTYGKLGMHLTCEPQYETNKLYHR